MPSLPEGVCVPLITTFSGGKLHLEATLKNLGKWLDTELQGFLVLGSTGETPLLQPSERLDIVSAVAPVINDSGKALLIGVMEESTDAARKFIADTAKYEPAAFLVLPPTYYKPKINADLITKFYADLADSAPGNLMLYNVPQFSGIEIETDTILQAARDKHIIGWKDSSTDIDRFAEVCRKTESDFCNFIGNPGLFGISLQRGAMGGILAAANAFPELCCNIYNAVKADDEERSQTMQNILDELVRQILVPYGIAGLKTAMDARGFSGGRVREPYINLSDGEQKQISDVIARVLN